MRLFDEDRKKIETLGRATGNTLVVYDLLKRFTFLNAPKAAETTGLTPPTVRSAIDQLQELGVVKEVTGKQRDRVFVYENYLKILSEGIEPELELRQPNAPQT